MIEHLIQHGITHLAKHLNHKIAERGEAKHRAEIRARLIASADSPGDLDLRDLLASEFSVICDTCYEVDEDIETEWRITGKGNLKCRWCGSKNDFYECDDCDCVLFRETKRGNYRCINCDEKVPDPELSSRA